MRDLIRQCPQSCPVGSLPLAGSPRAGTPPQCCRRASPGAAAALLASAALGRWPVLAAALLVLAIAFLGPCYALLLGHGLESAAAEQADGTATRLVAAGVLGGALWTAVLAGGLAKPGLTAPAATACLGIIASAVLSRAAAAPAVWAPIPAPSNSRLRVTLQQPDRTGAPRRAV